MRHSLYLAWQYMRFHQGRTAVLVAVLTLTASLPVAIHLLVRNSERQLLARAQATPFIIGPKGSALDVVLHSLYFSAAPAGAMSMADVQRLEDSVLAAALPLYSRFYARGYPIVGTTLEYLRYRQLSVRAGRSLALLGECLLGASVAEGLGLRPGDTLLSSPENLFNLAGSYPLKMQVVGVLDITHSPDDLGVFVDLKTAWIIAGHGHGHQELVTGADSTVRLGQQHTNIVANAALLHYTAITPDNLASFHFHGDLSQLPLTAIMALPHDQKSAVLLQGRYATDPTLHLVNPAEVMTALMRRVFKVRQLFDAIFLVVSVTMALAVGLIIALSLRLRQHEINTIYRLGCQRYKMVELVAAEIGLIVVLSLACTAGLVAAASHWHSKALQYLLRLGPPA